MNKKGKENLGNLNITKGRAIANHDTMSISEDKKPLLQKEPTNNASSDKNNNVRSKKY